MNKRKRVVLKKHRRKRKKMKEKQKAFPNTVQQGNKKSKENTAPSE